MSSQGKKGKGLRELHEDLAKVREAEEAELKELWDKVDEEHV